MGRWDGGGTHTGPAFDDIALRVLPEDSGKKMRFTGTTVFEMTDGKIVEENALVALQGLGIVPQKAAQADNVRSRKSLLKGGTGS